MSCNPIPSNWPSFPPPEEKQDDVYRWIRDGDLDAIKNHTGLFPSCYGEWPILHVVILLGQTDIFQYLCQKKCMAYITSTTPNQLNILHVACQQNQTNMVQFIVENFCCDSYNKAKDGMHEDCYNQYHFMTPDMVQCTPLIYAIMYDNLETVEYIYELIDHVSIDLISDGAIHYDAARIMNYTFDLINIDQLAWEIDEMVEHGAIRCLRSCVEERGLELPPYNMDWLCTAIDRNDYDMFVYLFTHYDVPPEDITTLSSKAAQCGSSLISKYLVDDTSTQ